MADNGDWSEYQRLVMDKLDQLEKSQKETTQQVSAIRTDIAVLKVKSGMWGAAAGALTVSLAALAEYIRGRHN